MSQRPLDPVPSPGPRSMTPETPATPEPTETTEDPASVDLDEVLRPHTSRRWRLVQVGGVLVLLLIVVGVLLHGVAPSLLGSASTAPSGAAPISSTVVIMANVSFGVVTLNGKTLAGSRGSLPVVTTTAFHQGTNVVTLTAPPFSPHTCTITVFDTRQASGQANRQAGCGIVTGGTYQVNGTDVTSDFAVYFTLDSTDLPAEQAAQAYATAMQTIAAVPLNTVIPSGQYYAVGLDHQRHPLARQAATPLQADVLVSAPDLQAQAGFCRAHVLCAGHISLSDLGPLASPRTWAVVVGVTLSWRYTSPAGTVTTSPQLPFSTSVQMFLNEDQPSGTWSVLMLPAALVAGTGASRVSLPTLRDQLAAGLCNLGTQVVAAQAFNSVNSYGTGFSQDQGVAGCAIQVYAGGTVQGTFLWRFGALLAVDKGAHTLAPSLPLAPPAEIAAVGG